MGEKKIELGMETIMVRRMGAVEWEVCKKNRLDHLIESTHPQPAER